MTAAKRRSSSKDNVMGVGEKSSPELQFYALVLPDCEVSTMEANYSVGSEAIYSKKANCDRGGISFHLLPVGC